MGKVEDFIDESGNITKFTYDKMQNITSITSPTGAITKYEYDIHNRLNRIIDAEGHATSFAHDSNGNITNIVNPLGEEIEILYDQLNRERKIFEPNGTVTRFEYDEVGNVIEVVEYSGESQKSTKGVYDELNRLTTAINSDGRLTKLTYTPLGQLESVTNQNNETKIYKYDGLNKLKSIIMPDGVEKMIVNNRVHEKTPKMDLSFFSSDIPRPFGELPPRDRPAPPDVVAGAAPSVSQITDAVSGSSVLIDPGHGGEDIGAYNGSHFESVIALDIANRVRDILEDYGITVYMARTSQNDWNTPMSRENFTDQNWRDFPESDRSPGERARHANALDVDILLSIHLNSNNTGFRGFWQRSVLDQGKGTTVIYDSDSDRLLASLINRFVGNNTSLRENAIIRNAAFGILSESNMTAVITETGYMGGDIAILLNMFERQRIANSIADGVVQYLLHRNTECTN